MREGNPQVVAIIYCKVHAESTMGNEPNRRKAGHRYLQSTAGHVGTGGDGRAWLQHRCCAPMDCQCPISGRQDWWYRSCQDYLIGYLVGYLILWLRCSTIGIYIRNDSGHMFP